MTTSSENGFIYLPNGEQIAADGRKVEIDSFRLARKLLIRQVCYIKY